MTAFRPCVATRFRVPRQNREPMSVQIRLRPPQGHWAGFAETLSAQEATAMQAMTGGADPHALVEALAQTELAVETAVTLRNKVVEAYQEILRMPV